MPEKQIGTDQKKTGKSEQIGVTPFCRPQSGSSELHVMTASLSVRPKWSHRCVSLKEFPLKLVQILQHATRASTEQASMRTKWFKHIENLIVQAHLLFFVGEKQGKQPKEQGLESLAKSIKSLEKERNY